MESETPAGAPHETPAAGKHDLYWALAGGNGLRAGWAVLLFAAVFYLVMIVLDLAAVTADPALARAAFSPSTMVLAETLPLLAMAAAGLFLARVEQRGVLDYHWGGPRAAIHFAAGLGAGFAALSLLVGTMAAGGWLRFGPAAPGGARVLKYGAVWAMAFLLTALFEEGTFRCFLLATLKRGMNFWWALGTVAAICAAATLRAHGGCTAGVYAAALAGLGPCAWLHWKRAAHAGFWQAAWTTSAAFGAYHTGNRGETAVGIFAAALIGFIFCVSVRLTQSVWWAVGCHAAWDWAETFFYGTANSGFATRGHWLTTAPEGNPLWSGGADGPEGSLLMVPVTLALLGVLVAVYRQARTPGLLQEKQAQAG